MTKKTQANFTKHVDFIFFDKTKHVDESPCKVELSQSDLTSNCNEWRPFVRRFSIERV